MRCSNVHHAISLNMIESFDSTTTSSLYYVRAVLLAHTRLFVSFSFFLKKEDERNSLFVAVSIIKNNVRRILNRYSIIVNFWRVCILDVL